MFSKLIAAAALSLTASAALAGGPPGKAERSTTIKIGDDVSLRIGGSSLHDRLDGYRRTARHTDRHFRRPHHRLDYGDRGRYHYGRPFIDRSHVGIDRFRVGDNRRFRGIERVQTTKKVTRLGRNTVVIEKERVVKPVPRSRALRAHRAERLNRFGTHHSRVRGIHRGFDRGFHRGAHRGHQRGLHRGFNRGYQRGLRDGHVRRRH
ncbi:MAG: hypothetical protein AAFR38_14555 [Planctomycetota bacterium]